jgi:hypothetical protein
VRDHPSGLSLSARPGRSAIPPGRAGAIGRLRLAGGWLSLAGNTPPAWCASLSGVAQRVLAHALFVRVCALQLSECAKVSTFSG